MTSAHVFPGFGHRHGRYHIRVTLEEPLRLCRPVVRRDVGAERINQMLAIRMNYETIQRIAVKPDQGLQFEVLHDDFVRHDLLLC